MIKDVNAESGIWIDCNNTIRSSNRVGSTIAAGFVANGDTPPTVSRSQEEDLPDLSNSRGLTMIFLCMKNSYTEIFAFYKVVGRRYMFKALN